jgi:kumamolisin
VRFINQTLGRLPIPSFLVCGLLLGFATPVFAAGLTPSAAARNYTLEVPSAAGIQDAGPISATAPIAVGFVLSYQHADELERDVLRVSTKGSPLYHHFVSSAQWNSYFAPSAATVASTAALLQAAGFRIKTIADNRGVIDAVAPAGTVSRFFGTQLRAVMQPAVGLRYRNVTPAIIPQGLRGAVLYVTGLDTLERHRLPAHPLVSHRAAVADATPEIAAPKNGIGGPVTAPGGLGYGPAVLANGYDYPVQHGFDGKGSTVGITIPDAYLDSDTAAFLKYFKIKQTGKVRLLPVDGGYTGPLEGEATLDTETISSLAPGANIDVYEFPDFTTRSEIDTYNRVISDNIVDSVSNSWGSGYGTGCDSEQPPLYLAAENILLQQAALKGITYIFSSGDSGAYGCYPPSTAPGVDDPASLPWVTAVGGISFAANSAGKITSTTASWIYANGFGLTPPVGGGGGVSPVWALPDYQKQVAASTKGRNVPDLSLPGDLEDAWYVLGTWNYGPVGGTSWSAPAFNAMIAEINEVIAQENGLSVDRSGFVNPALYAAYGAVGGLVFTDVTHGNNGGFFGPHYQARPGYDLATGLGTPIGYGLAEFL